MPMLCTSYAEGKLCAATAMQGDACTSWHVLLFNSSCRLGQRISFMTELIDGPCLSTAAKTTIQTTVQTTVQTRHCKQALSVPFSLKSRMAQRVGHACIRCLIFIACSDAPWHALPSNNSCCQGQHVSFRMEGIIGLASPFFSTGRDALSS
ncbi:hypothetical protein DUNSADRAFT_15015 [Dunaliella salina]|uniref:Encoded protein n=1 Tax=Dunaliella salina TaxID=3046 RepID=A0ABQ7G6E6_DUNSA|nr:hypothetical protein DUNSADRAFT_15015 [Dunaliella salina]|eukprot:KAF5830125.1 hypothetical protein DUNSADRAFT_15015 [Dunaliella salina]